MPLLSYTEAPSELLTLFNSEKESVLARYYEPGPGLFIAESAKVTLRAAKAGYALQALFVEDTQLNREALELLSGFPDVPAYHAPSGDYLRISGYPMTRGVLALFRRKKSIRPAPVTELPQELLADASGPAASASAHPLRIAVLEGVGNPANIGSIFRNAAALGIDHVLLAKGCCDPLSRRCLRVSMGCVFQVPWTVTSLDGAELARLLKTHGIRTAAMALTGDSVSVSDQSLKGTARLAIFLGNEGNGLPKETISACDSVVLIPMRKGIDSLNVAAASAVAFWELRKH